MPARIVVIEPNVVCLAKPQKHQRRESFYVIRGTVELINGEMNKEMKSGDIMSFDPYDEHYLTSGPDGVVLYEAIERI